MMDSCQLRVLDRESLTKICSLLDPVTLAKFSCTSRELRDACFQNCLWERISKQRWRHINADLYVRAEDPVGTQSRNSVKSTVLRQQHRQPLIDFRNLYANNNGWTPLLLHETPQHVLFSHDKWDFCVSRAPASKFYSGAGDAVYTVDTAVRLWSTGDSSQVGWDLMAVGDHHPSMYDEMYSMHSISNMTELAEGIVATGGHYGDICLHELRPDTPASTHAGAMWHNDRRYQYDPDTGLC